MAIPEEDMRSLGGSAGGSRHRGIYVHDNEPGSGNEQ